MLTDLAMQIFHTNLNTGDFNVPYSYRAKNTSHNDKERLLYCSRILQNHNFSNNIVLTPGSVLALMLVLVCIPCIHGCTSEKFYNGTYDYVVQIINVIVCFQYIFCVGLVELL